MSRVIFNYINKILFLTKRLRGSVGGVERHVRNVSKFLIRKHYRIGTIEEGDINPLKIKYLGLLNIWIWVIKNRRIFENADIIHCHDVYIWYMPLNFLFPRKKVVITIHGLEWDDPLKLISILQKRLAVRLSDGSIGIGKFLEKYLHVKFNIISYGAVNAKEFAPKPKIKNSIVYVGRLEKNTGILKFLKWLEKNNKENKYHVDFCGEGNLRKECERYGTVHGFTNPAPYIRKAAICVPAGYLAALEAMAAKCRIMVFWNNNVKKDYWQMTPFYKWIIKDDLKSSYDWAKKQTWEKLANEYIDLYNSIK